MADALVIGGAVLKGPFAAGALAVLSEPAVRARLGLDFRRVVATSAGALSGVYYAAATHAGEEAGAGARLARIWIEEARIDRTIALSARSILRRRGISSSRKILSLLEQHVLPKPGKRPISLRLIAANLEGEVVAVRDGPVMVHEHMFAFEGDDFATRAGLDRIFEAAVASAAFPGVFDPVRMHANGSDASFVDGGAVNEAPLGCAIEGEPQVRRVFVITPNPRVARVTRPLAGLAYFGQLADVLLEERLARDLRAVERRNEVLRGLERVVPDATQRKQILDLLGRAQRSRVDVVEIRPDQVLPGSVFSGWFSRALRERYVAEGRAAAERALAEDALTRSAYAPA